MIPNDMVNYGGCGSAIRDIAEYGDRRAREIGAENVFNFSLGNPSVNPPPCVKETIIRLLETMEPTALHSYTSAAGIASVREAVARHLNVTFDGRYQADDIFMTSGASSALAILTKALLLPGEDVLTLTPYFPEYRTCVEAVGGHLVEVLSNPDDFQIDLAAVERALSPQTKAMIVNSPNNPSGVILSRESLTALAAVLERKEAEYGHPIYVIADEPYRDLVYGGLEAPFFPRLYRNTLYCYSFSKSLSLPGERIGFIAFTPDMADGARVRAAVSGAARVLGYVCLPPLFQYVVASCIGQTADLSVYEDNRNVLYDALSALGYQCIRPDGAFYLFIKTLEPDSRRFCKTAQSYELLLVPGDDFGCPGYARIAYCVSRAQIERSLPAFAALAKAYRQ